MWLDKLDSDGALRLICEYFDWEELWEAAVELNQLCASRNMGIKIPKNRDQGVLKDRVSVLGKAVLASMGELKTKDDPPVYYVTSATLSKVPGAIKDTVQAEPAVTARLDNIEKMMEQLSKGLDEIKSDEVAQWPPLLQVNGAAAQPGQGQPTQAQQGQVQQGHGQLGVGQQHLAAKTRSNGNIRARSPSIKRSADTAELGGAQTDQSQGEMPWSQVVGRNQGRKPRKVQYGTAARVKVAAP